MLQTCQSHTNADTQIYGSSYPGRRRSTDKPQTLQISATPCQARQYIYCGTSIKKLGCLIYTSCSSTTSTHLATMAFAVASRRSSVLVQAKKGGKAKAPAKVRIHLAGTRA
jgi:hypothetical protein